MHLESRIKSCWSIVQIKRLIYEIVGSLCAYVYVYVPCTRWKKKNFGIPGQPLQSLLLNPRLRDNKSACEEGWIQGRIVLILEVLFAGILRLFTKGTRENGDPPIRVLSVLYCGFFRFWLLIISSSSRLPFCCACSNGSFRVEVARLILIYFYDEVS